MQYLLLLQEGSVVVFSLIVIIFNLTLYFELYCMLIKSASNLAIKLSYKMFIAWFL